jgi:hypothetical protein
MKNLDTFTIIADHGLGLIRKKENSNILTDQIIDFKKLKFADYYKKHQTYMNPIHYKNLFKLI